MLVSALLASLEGRPRNPFATGAEPDGPSRDDLIATLLDVDRRETSALLAVIAAMVDDEMLRRRIDRQLRARTRPLPPWLSELSRATATESAYEAVHVLGDGDNIAVGVHLRGSEDIAVMVYVDHNLGTVVKDAMAVPMPLSTLVEQLRGVAGDPDVTVRALDGADARARLEDAIRTGSSMFPPIEADSWPAARPLVEWALRLLPDGGSTFPRPEWNDDALNEVRERFFASPFGAGLDASHVVSKRWKSVAPRTKARSRRQPRSHRLHLLDDQPDRAGLLVRRVLVPHQQALDRRAQLGPDIVAHQVLERLVADGEGPPARELSLDPPVTSPVDRG